MLWIRCPNCDVAFGVAEERSDTTVYCPACCTRLGALSETSTRVPSCRPIETVSSLWPSHPEVTHWPRLAGIK
jgi:uncharacterized paraquat-inducible protein A